MSYTSDPAGFAVAVTPSDSTILTPTRGLYIGGTGDVVVQMYGSENTVTFSNVPVGVLPVRVTKVMAATGATNIVALW
jgi:hypothetical protein